jgi:MFS family permease
VKSLIAIVAGVIVGGVVAFLVQDIGNLILAAMAGIEPNTAQGASELATVRPTETLLVAVLAYLLGPMSGGYIAARLAPAKRYYHAIAVGAVQLIFGVITLTLFPHPDWFWIATLIIFIPAALAGAGLVRRGRGRRQRRQPPT